MLQSRTLRLLRLELLTALENFILPPWKRKGRAELLERLYPRAAVRTKVWNPLAVQLAA